jgi:hypothetical protein
VEAGNRLKFKDTSGIIIIIAATDRVLFKGRIGRRMVM